MGVPSPQQPRGEFRFVFTSGIFFDEGTRVGAVLLHNIHSGSCYGMQSPAALKEALISICQS